MQFNQSITLNLMAVTLLRGNAYEISVVEHEVFIKILSSISFHRSVLKRMEDRHCIPRASDLAFTTALALIPMLGLLIALFHSFDTLRELNIGLEHALLHFLLPHTHEDLAPHLMTMVEQARQLGGMGIIFAFITSIWLFHTVAVNFDAVWDGLPASLPRGMSLDEKVRFVWRRILYYLAMLVLLYGFLAMSFWITGELKDLVHYDALANHRVLSLTSYELIAASIAFMAFFLLYAWIPGQPEKKHESPPPDILCLNR